MGGTHFLQTGYLLLNRNAPFLYQFQFDAQFSHSNYTIKLVNNSTVILEHMRKVRTVFCLDFLAQL